MAEHEPEGLQELKTASPYPHFVYPKNNYLYMVYYVEYAYIYGGDKK